MSEGSLADCDRVAGLDVWRAALMLGGLFLHGAIGLPETGLFRSIDLVSQTFRMGAFYGIAGVLTALVLTRRSPEAWLRRRLTQLGVPLAFGLAAISPFIWLMATTFGWPEATVPLMFDWHHLWFLAGLIVYSTIVYGLALSRLDARVQAHLEDELARGTLQASTIPLLTTVATAMLFGLAPIVMNVTMSGPVFGAFRTLQLVAGYLPMFLLGYLAGRSPILCTAMLDRWRAAAVVVVGVGAIYLLWFVAIVPLLDPVAAATGSSRLRFLGAAICPPAAFVLILRSALTIRCVPPLLARISRASYTIYLLHLPIAVTVNLALRPLGLDPYLSYTMAVAVSAVTSFAFHEHVARRSALLMLLLNGKPLPRPIAQLA